MRPAKIGLQHGFVIHHRAGERERGAEEIGDFRRRTDGVLGGSQFRADFIELDGLLGEHGAGAFLPVGHGFPLVVELLLLRAEIFVESWQNCASDCLPVWPRSSSPSKTALTTCSLSTGIGTETPSALRMVWCLRSSTSRTMPSIWLSVP